MSTLHVESGNGKTRVCLNRPAVRNAFNEELIGELTNVFSELPVGTRVVELCGAGSVFCAGADLEWMKKSATFSEAENADDARRLAAMFKAIDEAPAVVIGRVQGAALGGGAGLVTCCDIVVASDDAKLGFTEVRLGLVPAVISPFVIRKIGVSQARRLFLTGEVFSAPLAKQFGLVHEVVATAELDATVQRLTEALLKNGPAALRSAKELVRAVLVLDAERILDYTVGTIAALRVSAEGQEGLAAFLEKRPPRWP